RRLQIGQERESHAQLPYQADVLGRGVGDDEERWVPHLVRAVAHVLRPAVGTVDGVEQPSAHHDRATGCRRSFEDLDVDGVLSEDPRVELGRVAEPVLDVGTGPRHETIERHGDVGDHLRHGSLLLGSSLALTAGIAYALRARAWPRI